MIALALLLAALPSTPVVHGPRSTTDRTPTYRFLARETGVPARRIHFRCAFDRPKLHACRARYSQRLAVGRHVLRVQAVDPAGRRSRVRKVRVAILRAGGPRLRRIQIGGRAFSLVEAAGSIWVADFSAGTVDRIDPGSNQVVARVDVGGQPYGLTAGAGSIWVGNNALDSVARIDTATNKVTATVTVGDRPLGLAYDATNASVWVADFGDSAVTRIDAATNTVLGRAVIPGEHEDVELGFGSVWIPSEEGTLTRVDPATLGVLATIPVGNDPDFALVAAESLWTTAYRGSGISRVDPGTNTVTATLPSAAGLQGIAFDGADFWVANYNTDTLSRIDPASGKVLGRWTTGAGPRDVLVTSGGVWVADSRAQTVTRLSPVP